MQPALSIPIEPLFILHTLRSHGYEAYIVGGAVRDLLRNAESSAVYDTQITDFDFTTNATPEQILTLFPNSFYENIFGTVSITPKHVHEMMGWPEEQIETEASEKKKIAEAAKVIDLTAATKIHESLRKNDEQKSDERKSVKPYEITTYRSDGIYSDHRRPESVSWGKTLQEDLSRRDFTINALALEIKDAFLNNQNWTVAGLSEENEKPDKKTARKTDNLAPENYTLIDLFQGLDDLRNHQIRTVGDPTQRFREDALRMLRAIRFSVQLNMRMSDDVFTAISALAADIQHVSWERIRDEFMKMLASDFPAEAIELLEETGLLHFILPEVREGRSVEQGGHHTTDVWVHSLDALRCCPSTNPVVRLATLLHDVGKPRTFRVENGKITFYNHEIVGARMAGAIAQRLRLSKQDSERIFTLVRYHMFYYQPHNTDAAIRRFMRNVGLENIDDILDLREADRLGSGARKTSWRLEEMKQRMIEQLHQPFAITDLAIDGTTLMEKFGLTPGPLIGRILKTLFEEVLEHPELNTPETLLAKAQELIKQELITDANPHASK